MMESSKKLDKLIGVLHPLALLLLSLLVLLLVFASGHSIGLEDTRQIKLIVEMLVFLGSGIYLLAKWEILVSHFEWIATGLMLLVQVSLGDLYYETSSEEKVHNAVLPFLAMFALLSVTNLFLIYKQIRNRVTNQTQ